MTEYVSRSPSYNGSSLSSVVADAADETSEPDYSNDDETTYDDASGTENLS